MRHRSEPSLLGRAGLLGAGLAAGSVLAQGAAAPAYASSSRSGSGGSGGFLWLSGDHHIHTQYSDDGKYRIGDQVRQGARHGLDWLVITDHGNETHARIGVEKVNPDIKEARDTYDDTLVFQGLEWNIPGAEHATVFVHPGKNEVAVLKEFETSYDGRVKDANSSTPANEALAVAGLRFLSEQVQRRKVKDALMLANHPARRGAASTRRTRSVAGATRPPRATGSPSASRARRATRPPVSPRRWASAGPGASTTTTRLPTPSPVTRWRVTAPGAASTG